MSLIRIITNSGFAKGALEVGKPDNALLGEIRAIPIRMGCGTELLLEFENEASRRGAKRVTAVLGRYSDTEPEGLKRFYQKNGYILDESDPVMIVARKELR